jgi:hypothetical protein
MYYKRKQGIWKELNITLNNKRNIFLSFKEKTGKSYKCESAEFKSELENFVCIMLKDSWLVMMWQFLHLSVHNMTIS